MAFDSGIDLSTFQSDYLESSDWNIQNTTAEKKIMPPGANDTASTYAVLTFEINMKRKLVFSSYILTLPCVFLACLTLVVFWLPPDRPDRTALAMSIFSSFLVLLLILVEAAPPTASSVPVLGVYYCFNLVIIMVAVFLSALVVNVCRAGETKRKVPRWLKKLCIDWIGKVLFVPTMSQETADMASVFRNEGMQFDATPQQETRILDYTPEKLVRVAAQCNGTYRSTVELSENTRLVEGQMKEMRKSLAHIKSNMVEKAVTEYNNSQCIKEWRDVSLVMDRVFFIVYIILIVVSLITLFPRPGR